MFSILSRKPGRVGHSDCCALRRSPGVVHLSKPYAVTEDLSAKSRFIQNILEVDLWPASLSVAQLPDCPSSGLQSHYIIASLRTRKSAGSTRSVTRTHFESGEQPIDFSLNPKRVRGCRTTWAGAEVRLIVEMHEVNVSCDEYPRKA